MGICGKCGRQWPETTHYCPIDGTPCEPEQPGDLRALIGRVLNRTYRIEEMVGQGGIGAVFRARHLGIGDAVAVKVIRNTLTSDLLARFRREAQAARRLAHPNAVSVYDFNITDDGLVFMVMEYVKGETVDHYLQKHGPLTPQRAWEILRPVAAALDVAHALGIIHRDLKPANLMICQDSAGHEQVKVLDFGTVRLTIEGDAPEQVSLTHHGQIFGTPLYMSPEQAMSDPTSAATDIYSLGVILYQMLAGRVPFLAPKSFQTMMAHVNQAPEPPSSRNKELPACFDEVVLKALEKSPENRYATAGALIEQLAATIGRVAEQTSGYLPINQISFEDSSNLPNFNQHVGRAQQLARLQAEFQQARAGGAQPVFIVGAPGIGKSQLMAQFREWVEAQQAQVLTGKFFDYGGSTIEPLRLFKNMLMGALSSDITISDSLQRTDERFRNFLGVTSAPMSAAGADKWQVFGIQLAVIEKLASTRPVVMMLDDLQWADSLSLEFIGFLLRNIGSLPFLFIGTARAEEANTPGHTLNEWLGAQARYYNYEKIELSHFDTAMIETLLQSIFGLIEISKKDLATLHSVTAGNPFYLAEVIRLLVDNQKIRFHGGIWTVAPFEGVKLPQTIATTINSKLESCTEELRDLLAQAAIIGDDFRLATLAELANLDADSLTPLLNAALDACLICKESNALGDDYRFYHTTIRRVIYENISARKKRKLHLRAAATIEKLYAGRLTYVLGTLVYHYYAAGEWRKAFDFGVQALNQAWQQESWSEAVKYAQWLEEAIARIAVGADEGPPVALPLVAEIKLKYSTTLVRMAQIEAAIPPAQSALQIARELKSDLLTARCQVSLCNLGWFQGSYGEMVRLAQEGLNAVARCQDAFSERYLHFYSAMAKMRSCSFADALWHFQRSYELAVSGDDFKLQPQARAFYGLVSHSKGDLRTGLECLEEAIVIARRHGDKFSESRCYGMLALALYYERRHEALAEIYQQGIEIARSLGWRIGEMHQHIFLGLDHLTPTNLNIKKADELLHRAIAICQESGEKAFQLMAQRGLAHIHSLNGEYQQSIARFQEILSTLRRMEDLVEQGPVYYLLGEAQEAAGSIEAALDSYTSAYKVAHQLVYVFWEYQSLYGQARCLQQLGDRTAARARLAMACDLVTRVRNEFPSTADAANFITETDLILNHRDTE